MSKPIQVTGTAGGITETDAARLSVVALRGNQVLATAPVQADGSYRLSLPHATLHTPSAYALQVALLPSTAAAHPDRVANAPRATIARELLHGGQTVRAPSLTLDPSLIDAWSMFWREWCVSGTMVGPDGCPAPAAEVTVYTVYWSGGVYHKNARGTVTTGPDGSFTLCFPWWELFFPCWPCEPIWWLCWPWWWERDILHVIDTLETRAVRGPHSTALFRPAGNALIRGQGFTTSANAGVPVQDPARTALIKRKFANKALRDIFPWTWWCCDQPNIVFGATQGPTTILAEDPSLDTRWCMESGQSVTLTGTQATLTTCPAGPPPESGMVWTRVGDILTTSIDAGGLAQDTGDWVDVAFAGWLELYAGLAPGACAYYQVTGSVWNAPAFRGGTKPAAGSGAPIAATLWQTVWIFDPATLTTTSYDVKMGPFTANGVANLYATQDARQNLAAPAGLAAFPPVPAGGEVFWAYEGLVLATDGATLLGGVPFGAVDLTLVGYDQNFAPVGLVPDAPLTLAIDETPVTTQKVNAITAWRSPGVAALQSNTGECPAYDVGPAGFIDMSVTVQDTNGFLYGYEIEAQYGAGSVAVVNPPGVRGYVGNPLVVSPTNPDYPTKSWVGGTETIVFPGNTLGGPLPPDCCYEFRLYYGKRVTDGYTWPSLGEGDFQTISLRFSS